MNGVSNYIRGQILRGTCHVTLDQIVSSLKVVFPQHRMADLKKETKHTLKMWDWQISKKYENGTVGYRIN